MNNQERNREALIEHIAEQDRIIRRRNEQIANQAHNARESQRAIEEQDARNNSLAADLAAAVARAEKAERERDEARRHECSDLDAHWRLDETLASLKEANATVASLRAENPRPLTANDITDEMIERALAVERRVYDDGYTTEPVTMRELLTAALTEPTRPEGAEKVEAVLNQYWSGDINGDDLADRIVEEMNR